MASSHMASSRDIGAAAARRSLCSLAGRRLAAAGRSTPPLASRAVGVGQGSVNGKGGAYGGGGETNVDVENQYGETTDRFEEE